MTYTNEKEIAKALKEGISPLYFVCGDDEYLKRSCSKAIVKEVFGGKPDDMNFQKIDGQDLDIDSLCDSVEAMPFFAEKRCVFVDGIDVDSLLKNDKDKLCELISNPNPYTVQIYYAKEDVGGKTSSTLKKIMGIVDKAGVVIQFGKRDKAGLTKYIKTKAKSYECEISPKLCQKLIEYCSSDMQRIITETDKLFAFRSGGTIDEDDIEAVVTADVNARVFDLWSKIYRNDYLGAMGLLGDLFYLREEPIGILGALSMNICDVYRVKLGTSVGKNVNQVGQDLNIKSTFRLRKAQSFTGNITLNYLRKAIDILCKADTDLKSSPLDGKLILEKAITELFVLSQEEMKY